jgi:hypothetical protein
MFRPRRATLPLAGPHHRPIRIESETLTIELGPEAETCLVKLAGELDLASVPALHRAHGDTLRIVDPRGDVDRILRLAGMREMLPLIEQ